SLPTGLSNLSDIPSISELKSNHPSFEPPTSAFFLRVGDSGSASSTCFMTSSSDTHTIILISAALHLYTMSFIVRRCVAGMHMAPILWRPSRQNQNSYLLFRISITGSPFLMPCALKKFAALLL